MIGPLLATLSLAAPLPRVHVGYAIHLANAGGATSVTVRATVSGVPGRRLELTIPQSWAGQDSLRKSFADIRVMAPARLVADSGGFLVIEHASGTPVSVTFRLRQDWTGPLRWPQYHRPYIDSSHVVFNTQNGLIYPRLNDDTPLQVRVTWTGVPTTWPLATSLGPVRDAAHPMTMRELETCSFVTGAFRTLQSGRDGPGAMTILTEGTWRFPDSALAGLQQRVWDRERRFWNDEPFGKGYIVIMPTAQRGTTGGTAFLGGFVEIADSTSTASVIVRVAAHELMHMWNGQLMNSGERETWTKWYFEGFTDYYADRFHHEAGGSTDSGYVASINRNAREYYISPYIGQSRDTVASQYWTTPNMQFYPYRQGYLFAFRLDGELRAASHDTFTIDSLVQRMYHAARRAGGTFTDSLFLASTPDRWRDVTRDAVSRYINRGDTIPAPGGVAASCYRFADSTIARFDLGFAVDESTRDHVMRGVVPGGAADRAGLRNGMQVRAWGWYNGDATRNATVRITDSTGDHSFIFLPRGATVVVPQLHRDSTLCPG